MADIQHYERVFKKKRVGLKIAFIALYIFIASAWFVLSARIYFHYTFVLLAPLSILIAFLFTWRYTNVEYEYSFEGGILTFAKIYGKSIRKCVLELEIKAFDEIIPYNDKTAKRHAKAKLVDGILNKNAENPCLCVFKDESEDMFCFLFDCDEQSAKILKFFAPSITDRAIFDKLKKSEET